VQVACGILRRADGQVLIAQRPPGKLAAGAWEFPGGKIEPGETAEAALLRELAEELGVSVGRIEWFQQITHAYRDRIVVLETYLIDAFEGEPEGREGQALRWVDPRTLGPESLLAADWPIVQALRTPRHYVITPAVERLDALIQGLPRLPRRCWLRLRQPQLSDVDYRGWAQALRAAVAGSDVALIVDGEVGRAESLGAEGWHATAAQLLTLRERPLPKDLIFVASTHNAAELEAARRLGADAVVFGPIHETASHPGQPGVGWSALCSAVSQIACPVFALGGLDENDLPQVRACGAHGVAGISAYWSVSSRSDGEGSTGTR
jgi:8-oxo-dGTP diphosphatase